MNLSEAGRPERLGIELGEQLADPAVQLLLDRLLHVLEGDLADVILKLRELPDVRGRKQVRARRQHLSQLDVGRAELDEALPERDSAVLGTAVIQRDAL